jgi:hypothetical protein
MRQLAQDHGQAGWHAQAFPLSVDGIEIVASLVLLADRRAGRKSGWLPWAALAIGTAGSLAANVATAGPGIISRIIAGWPAVALLIAVKLLSGILEHRVAAEPTIVRAGDPARSPTQIALYSLPAGPADTPSSSPHRAHSRVDHPRPTARQVKRAPGKPARREIAVLEQAACAVRDQLHRDGRRLTRDALATGLRAAGHPVRNARLTQLLAALRAEPTPTTLAAGITPCSDPVVSRTVTALAAEPAL